MYYALIGLTYHALYNTVRDECPGSLIFFLV
jgi:hypothetical protein